MVTTYQGSQFRTGTSTSAGMIFAMMATAATIQPNAEAIQATRPPVVIQPAHNSGSGNSAVKLLLVSEDQRSFDSVLTHSFKSLISRQVDLGDDIWAVLETGRDELYGIL